MVVVEGNVWNVRSKTTVVTEYQVHNSAPNSDRAISATSLDATECRGTT